MWLTLFVLFVYDRFFLEVLHNQKSTKLEWVIIILIGVEIVMGLFGHAKEYLNWFMKEGGG